MPLLCYKNTLILGIFVATQHKRRAEMAFFKRKIEKDLAEWRNDAHRKPLVLRGARQTGKTTIIRKFGESFSTFIELNLEKRSDAALFEYGLGVTELLDLICLEKHAKKSDEMLLFIDEIQNSPEAVAMMRYFFEEMPGMYVIGAGSLLEIMMEKSRISFPVGRVSYIYLYPMDFDEFLMAMGEDAALELLDRTPFPDYALDTLMRLYKEYMLVGGMPEAMAAYAADRDISSASDIYSDLLSSFSDDVGKYAAGVSETQIIRHVMETVPYETGKRITFQNFGNSGYRSREVGNALRTLERAMLLYLRYPVTETSQPVLPDLKRKPRLQFIDTGLLNYAVGLQAEYFKNIPLSNMWSGMLAEQITGQQLLASNNKKLIKPLFWVRESSQSNAELDFLLTGDNGFLPVEVKSGKTGTLRSLHSFVDRSGCGTAVRLYSGKYCIEEAATPAGNRFRLINMPLFLAQRINMNLV